MVAEEMVSLRLCSCSSMSISSDRRLEGKLVDLIMEAMAETGSEENGEKIICNGVDQVYGFPVYITKEAEAMALWTLPTRRISLVMKCWAVAT